MKLFLLLVLVALLGSCIKEIDKVTAFEGPKLVVNSLINPDSMVRVNVSLSGSNAQGAQFLNDVNVQLFEDGQLYTPRTNEAIQAEKDQLIAQRTERRMVRLAKKNE